jgi:ferredoxin-type protein NapH
VHQLRALHVACSMSFDVNVMIQARAMEHSDCILCGGCINVCPKDVIAYVVSAGK